MKIYPYRIGGKRGGGGASWSSKSYSLVRLEHSGVAVCSFGGAIASLPQLRGRSVRAGITNIYLLLHGLHTLQGYSTCIYQSAQDFWFSTRPELNHCSPGVKFESKFHLNASVV